MIPKVIHYCWFGGGPLNELSEKCIASWRKFCPDYEIVRWDESNYDVTKNNYMRQAYEAKKWAFVSDYARLDIIYEHGGIYLDTDVELVKPLDGLLERKGFLGVEQGNYVASGLGFGGEAGAELFRILQDDYDAKEFLLPDGAMNLIPAPKLQTAALEKLGYSRDGNVREILGVSILPADVLASRDWYYGTLETTERTVAIHQSAASWFSKRGRAFRRIRFALVRCFGKKVGGKLAQGIQNAAFLVINGAGAVRQRIGK